MSTEQSSRIFVDSNYVVALFNPTDGLHKNALEIASAIEAQQRPLVISNFIFLEIVTVLSQRRGKDVAREVGQYLLGHPFVTVIHADESLQRETWEIFQNVDDKNISFVDSSIIAIMQAEDINTLLTLDTHDFKKLQKQYKFKLFV